MRKMNPHRNLYGRNLRRVARHGGLPKDDQAGGGTPAPTPAPTGNNGGESSGGSASESQTDNNSGQDFDPATFWTGPSPSPTPAPSGESAGNQGGGSDTGQGGGGNLQEILTNQLANIQVGDLMTADIAQQINNGDFTGIQKAFNDGIQQAVRQSLSLNVQIMRPLADQIMAQVREEFGDTLNQRDNNDALVKDFPTAANPQVRPIIEGIFKQALKNTNNNRAEAVRQTKEMIRLTANLSADDLGVTVAPRGPDDSGAPKLPANFNWLDELTGR